MALQAEGRSDRTPAPDAVVDHEILAIETARRAHLTVGEIGEERLVEIADVVPALCRTGRPADDVMLHVGSKRGEHAIDIVSGLEAEMLVQLRIHLRTGQRHHLSPSLQIERSSNETIVSRQETCLVAQRRAGSSLGLRSKAADTNAMISATGASSLAVPKYRFSGLLYQPSAPPSPGC